MHPKIERLLKVPRRRIQSIREDLYAKRLGFLAMHSQKELLERLDNSDAALDKAMENIEIEVQKGLISDELVEEFRKAHLNYYSESEDLRLSILQRKSFFL